MNRADLELMFIRAAETEGKMPEVRGLREDFGRYTLPWVHELRDINGRGRTNIRAKNLRDTKGEKLLPGDDPLQDWMISWLDEWAKRATSKQVAAWEACLEIGRQFVEDAGQRRALWAWALAQAGQLHRPGSVKIISFAKWCREVEKVAEITGHRRKNRALDAIIAQYSGKSDLHCENDDLGVLPDTPENGHVFATVQGQRALYSDKPQHTWRDDPSFSKTGMTLSEWRAAKRRQQAAAKRKREQKAA